MTDASDANKIAFKVKLLVKLGLATGIAQAFGPRVHMIKAADGPGRLHRVQCADGSWIEINPGNRRAVRTWGLGHTAREMAAVIADADGAYDLSEHLGPTATAAAPGAPRRAAPVLPDDKLKTLADRWRQRGFADVELADDGVWVAVADGTRLYDVGTRVTVYGPVTDEALAAMVAKAKSDWDGQHRLYGVWTDHDRESMWLESQRQGVTLLDYEPSPALVARWEAEQAAGRGAQSLDASASVGAVPEPAMAGGDPAEPELDDVVLRAHEQRMVDELGFDPDVALSEAQAFADINARFARHDALEAAARPGVEDALIKRGERIQAALDALHARWSVDGVTTEDRERLRAEEAKLELAKSILERAWFIACQRGLDANAALAAARAELADDTREPARVTSPRR